MDTQLVQAIRRTMDTKLTDELIEIYRRHNEKEYSAEAFEAMRQVLLSRGESIPIIESETQSASRSYVYVSTYNTAKVVATCVSFIGWVVLAVSTAVLVVNVFLAVKGLVSSKSGFVEALALFNVLPLLGSVVSGLLLISVGQFTRAALDSADYNGEMLAITKANLSVHNKAAAS